MGAGPDRQHVAPAKAHAGSPQQLSMDLITFSVPWRDGWRLGVVLLPNGYFFLGWFRFA
jgi:hypothetical protein